MAFLTGPKIPSPQAQAAAQIDVNKKTTAMNLAAGRPDQITPTGSIKYTQSGTDQFGNPTWTATSELSPENKALLDRLLSSRGDVAEAGGNLAQNIAGAYGDIPDFGEAASSLTNKMLTRQAAYMDPYYKQQTENLENKLRNQGLIPGTPAFDRAMRTLLQTQNESRGQFLNQAQPIAFAQAMQNYQKPLDVIQQIMGMTGPMGIDPTQIAGIGQNTSPNMSQIMQNNYQAKLAQNNAMWQAIGSIVSGGMGLPTGVGSSTIGSTLGAQAGAGLSSMLGIV